VAEKYAALYKKQGVKGGRANFWGMITNIDENMGRLLDRLKDWGLEENTIVIFATDNGTSAGHHGGMRGRKGSEYDGGHRVPLFVRWPGKVGQPRDIGRLTAHIDVLPTLIELCGLTRPKGVDFDGDSLAPLLKGQDRWPDRTLFVHSQRIEHPKKWRKCAVMTDRWRLVNGSQLFDMPADPGQKSDVAKQHPQVVERLRAAYERWWESLKPEFDNYCRIHLGSEDENPARLTCHDWHGGGRVPWNQGMIKSPKLWANGFWTVDVLKAGRYRFTLRQRPTEAEFPIQATEARLKIGKVDEKKPIPEGATGVSFEVTLKTGPARLQTWFNDKPSGKSRGAYFVYVERL
jgi:hypothetical protein